MILDPGTVDSWTAKDWALFLPALGGFITGTIAAIASAVATIRAGKAAVMADQVKVDLASHDAKRTAMDQDTQAKVEVLTQKVEEVHKATNSITDRLVETTGVEAFARGKLEGECKK